MEDIIDIIVTETTNLIEITSQASDETIDVNIIDNREDITLNVTPSVVEININSLTGNFGVNWGDIDGTISNQTDLQNALNLKADLVDGKVPSSQLPSYVDDIVEVANYAALPATGEVGKIYITLDTNLIYRWTGSTYVEVKDSSAVWGAITGTLSSQTDLQSALDAKLSVTTAASTYLPLTGGTLSGILRVDSALRIKSGSANGILLETYSANELRIRVTPTSTTFDMSLVFPSVSRTYTYPNATGTIALTSDLTAYVPYTGATANVDLGAFTLLAAKGTFSSSGSSDTVGITHSSGSGIALNISKAGNGEGIYVNKTSGSGNAVTIIGTLNATTLVKSGGTSAQFLKADGSVDSSAYALDSAVVHLTGNETISGLKYFFSGTKNDLLFVSETVGYASIAGYSHFKANTNHVEFINSTNTKSTKFIHGNGAYEFTMPNASGTIALTSNLSSYLPLAGGTLTGALSGTSATFSGVITASDNIKVYGANQFWFGSGFRGQIVNYGAYAGTTDWSPFFTSETSLAFGVGGNATKALNIASTGAATFSSSVTAQAIYATDATGSAILTTNGGGEGILSVNTANPLRVLINGGEKVRITSGGKLLVGGTSDGNTGLVQIHGTARAVQLVASEGGITAGNYAVYGHDDNNGYINVVRSVFTGDFHFRFDGTSRANINRSTGAYTATSDSRLKTNISDSQSVLSLINQIKVRSYKWIENDMNEAYGLIAQELYEILPEYVYKPKIESENWGLSKAELVPMLVKAVQELSNKIKTLENK